MVLENIRTGIAIIRKSLELCFSHKQWRIRADENANMEELLPLEQLGQQNGERSDQQSSCNVHDVIVTWVYKFYIRKLF